jgi:hypothetical protein
MATGFEAKVTSEKEVTPSDIIAEAQKIHAKVRRGEIGERLHRQMQMEHNAFAQSYPIVLRYMCELGQFHPDALRRYLHHLKFHPWKSTDEYLDSQTHYIVLLYKAMNKQWKSNEVDTLRKNVRAMLGREYSHFEKITKETNAEVEGEISRLHSRGVKELASFYAKNQDELQNGVPVTVMCDKEENIVSFEKLAGELTSDITIEDM